MVFELDPHLPLVGLVSDEGVLQELVGGRPLRVVLHQTALDEAEELLGPENKITGEESVSEGTPETFDPLASIRQEDEGTDHFLDLSLGGGFLGMRKSARMGCISHNAAKHRHTRPIKPN